MVPTPVKKWLLTVAACALALSGLSLASATTASATGNGNETDLNGKWDNLLPNICQDGSNRSGQSVWYYNIATHELHDRSYYGRAPVYSSQYGGPRNTLHVLNPNWREIKGHCYYPQSSSWTYEGAETAWSEPASNCDNGGPLNYQVSQSYTTTESTTKTVGGSLSGVGKIGKMFEVGGGAEFEYSWSYGKSIGWGRTVGMSVPSGRTEWFGARPLKRVVRINPHFWLDSYTWNAGGTTKTSQNWGGWGYRALVDHDYYYDGTANVLNSSKQPQFRFILHGRANTRNDCN
ncbi:hypothetical protein [Streptomyces sp. AK08-02]|uniref:hypothetical protein n=1 Tax=Streptomyces sp. AK08-02 TaxID=3028654 RepID=UPI0029B1A0C9|nr:hypothetical protein [Streptomyces sp. AK08-02]MDX3745082.1 hypothetical protein [Streptomyces sp. AK08-02]